MNKEKEIVHTIKTSKLQYLGHIMRNPYRYQLLQAVLQGKLMGRRGVDRLRISWLKNLRIWVSSTTNQLFRAVVNKVMIAMRIADIQRGQALKEEEYILYISGGWWLFNQGMLSKQVSFIFFNFILFIFFRITSKSASYNFSLFFKFYIRFLWYGMKIL